MCYRYLLPFNSASQRWIGATKVLVLLKSQEVFIQLEKGSQELSWLLHIKKMDSKSWNDDLGSC